LEGGTQVHLFAGYHNSLESTIGGSPVYNNYIKQSEGYIDFTTGNLVFNSEGTNVPSKYIVDITKDIDYVSYITTCFFGGYGFIYIPTSQVKEEMYVTVRSGRTIATADIIVYKYASGSWEYRERSIGLNIEGITYISYFNIAPINGSKQGMVLSDQNGNILFRESTDGITWTIPAEGTGVILDNPVGYDLDYPCLIATQNNGLLVFFVLNYNDGTEGYIHNALSRDNGVTWEVPELSTNTLDIIGIFPRLIRRRNGNIYLTYHGTNAIYARRVYVTIPVDNGGV